MKRNVLGAALAAAGFVLAMSVGARAENFPARPVTLIVPWPAGGSTDVGMGTPDFAVPTLIEIVGRGHEIVAVYTRAAKPAGRRGLDLTPSPVEREARRFALPVLTPTTLRSADAEGIAHGHGADVAVIVAYGLILPKPILEAWPLGAFNLHASLLPRWRGAAPINRAIMVPAST